MTVSLIIDDKYIGEAASAGGWSDFCQWVRGLDADKRGAALLQLADYGWTEDAADLVSGLSRALTSGPIPTDIHTTASGLLTMLARHGDAKLVIITDGADSDVELDDEAEKAAQPVTLTKAATTDARVKQLQAGVSDAIRENADRLMDDGDDYDTQRFVDDCLKAIRDAAILAFLFGARRSGARGTTDTSAGDTLDAEAQRWADTVVEQQRPYITDFAADIQAKHHEALSAQAQASASGTAAAPSGAAAETAPTTESVAAAIAQRADLYTGSVWEGYQRGGIAQGAASVPEEGRGALRIKWNTSSDDRVCELCAGRDGHIYTEDSLPGYPGQGGFGDLCEGGPACRCFVSVVAEED